MPAPPPRPNPSTPPDPPDPPGRSDDAARRSVGGQLRDASAEVARYLRTETIGGAVMLVAAAIALVMANSGWRDSYQRLLDTTVGPAALHLDLSLADWARDGLLALFFFVAGLELKRELAVGDLSNPRAAMLPIWAALGGMVLPAVVFLTVAAGAPGAAEGWAIPVATDIAFALAVLAVTGSRLPRSVRVFLLSLAVLDDLGAILLIALLFTESVSLPSLAVAAGLLCLYAVLQWRRVTLTVLYVPLALGVWVAVHDSGVHATVAGILLGMLTRARHDDGEAEAPAERLGHRLQPWSAGVAVPLFALTAAGVPLGAAALGEVLTDRIAWAIFAGLLLGKLMGVAGAGVLSVRLRLATLPDQMHWRDLVAVGMVAGCGFTVSLLMSELALTSPAASERARTAVLLASIFATLASAVLLRKRVRARDTQA